MKKKNSSLWLAFLVLVFSVQTVFCFSELHAADTGNPVEIGDVHWRRDFKEVLSLSDRTGKPVFLLFQEVPG